MEGFLNPEEVLNQLELREDMIVVDFGSGSGGWSLPLAQRLKRGKVYAIDILEEPLSALRGKAEHEGIFNIKTILSDIEKKGGSKLPDNSCDLVLMTNLLFQVEDKKGVMEEGKRVLKKEGRILVVDWKKESTFGPQSGRISAEEVKKIAKELGFEVEKEFSAGSCHYALLLRKVE